MAAGAEETIKVISSLPLTGSSRTQSQSMVNGFTMAFEEAGMKAGPFKLVYESLDDATAQAGAWDAGQEKANASRAVADPDVMVYTGVYNSGAAKISIPILNQASMCLLSSGSTYPGLTKAGFGGQGEPDIYYPSGMRNYCRVVPADDVQGKAAAWWAQKKLNVKSVYILDDKELYGKGVARVFDEQCRLRGIEVLGHEGIDSKAPGYRVTMHKIKALKPDLLYFGGITQNGATKLVKDARDVDLNCLFMSPDGTKEEAFIVGAGPASEGCLITLGGVPVQELGAKAQDWYKRYKQRFGTEPEAYAIYSYEAGMVILKAIEKAGVKDRKKILEAIMGTKDFQGVLGTWSFDKNGDTTMSSMSGYQVENGQFAFVQVLTPDSPAPAPDAGPRPQSLSLVALFSTILDGLTNGSLIAIIALGYTLVYGIVELINFAHGDVVMMGSFAAATGVSVLGLNSGKPGLVVGAGLLLVLVVAMGFSGLINVLIDRLAYQRLRHAPRLVPLTTAIGMSFILMNLGGYWKGWSPVDFPVLSNLNLLPGTGVTFKFPQLFVILVTVPLLAGLSWFIYRTRLGKAMRATAQSPDAAQLMGIDVNRTIALAFLLGGALAGAAGLLYGVWYHEVRFDLGFRQGMNAFTAAVLGGIGNIRGAVVGGLIIGIVDALTTFFLAGSLAPAMVFAVLILIIMVRPAGLLGENVPEKV